MYVFPGAGLPVVSRSVGISVSGLPLSGARVCRGLGAGIVVGVAPEEDAAEEGVGGGSNIPSKTDCRDLSSGTPVSLPAVSDFGVGFSMGPGFPTRSGGRFPVKNVLSRFG